MAKPNSKGMNAKGRSARTGSFAGIPRAVMQSDSYKSLSPKAVKLLLELAYQFRGANNGDLTVALTVLRSWGWKSRTTITQARDELLAADLIVCTRQGQFTNPGGKCALYALVWQPIHECGGKLDVDSTSTPPRKF